ncbi:uncharacterized protein BCR38DRAFT_219897 [Pseudomassariella vexata]|uniref:Uncharacterized protein n=1 Tax=Pseudomassariella vexata TaxID=1141098 RepID=A0A1Y2DUT3_9PEZI|nr:uncharacterized protein BCR38DRAFT_219897 [Pseudomassariella vexata]ORY63040.1 hypothetical protein BCR38DRAFT_219897 [Pseudomassariella vexata]
MLLTYLPAEASLVHAWSRCSPLITSSQGMLDIHNRPAKSFPSTESISAPSAPQRSSFQNDCRNQYSHHQEWFDRPRDSLYLAERLPSFCVTRHSATLDIFGILLDTAWVFIYANLGFSDSSMPVRDSTKRIGCCDGYSSSHDGLHMQMRSSATRRAPCPFVTLIEGFANAIFVTTESSYHRTAHPGSLRLEPLGALQMDH